MGAAVGGATYTGLETGVEQPAVQLLAQLTAIHDCVPTFVQKPWLAHAVHVACVSVPHATALGAAAATDTTGVATTRTGAAVIGAT
jgi:hypothetical protein